VGDRSSAYADIGAVIEPDVIGAALPLIVTSKAPIIDKRFYVT
jgi:hypothetical protein